MKSQTNKHTYFFVDESGDPYFYNRHGNFIVGNSGCSKILQLGFIKTEEPEILRKKIKEIKNLLKTDAYLQDIPSLKKSLHALHATDDCPEVRESVYKEIVTLPFKAEFIVARKKEEIFIKRHRNRPNLFYDDLISKLFENQLHKAEENTVYFAVRGNRTRQVPLEDAIRKAVFTFEKKWNTKIDVGIEILPQRPEGEPCLQIIDYMNWAVQRAFVKQEMRYFTFVRDKISLVVDVYDFDKYPKNFFHKRNQFHINKISPL